MAILPIFSNTFSYNSKNISKPMQKNASPVNFRGYGDDFVWEEGLNDEISIRMREEARREAERIEEEVRNAPYANKYYTPNVSKKDENENKHPVDYDDEEALRELYNEGNEYW